MKSRGYQSEAVQCVCSIAEIVRRDGHHDYPSYDIDRYILNGLVVTYIGGHLNRVQAHDLDVSVSRRSETLSKRSNGNALYDIEFHRGNDETIASWQMQLDMLNRRFRSVPHAYHDRNVKRAA